MRRILLWLCASLITLLAVFLIFAPAYVDDQFNSPLPYEPYRVSDKAAAIFKSLPGVADLHADPLLWNRDLLRSNDRGHIDLPRLVEGRVRIQVFGVVTKTPRSQNYEANGGDTDNITLLAMSQLWPLSTWTSLRQRALYQADKLRSFAERSAGGLVLVRTRTVLRETLDSDPASAAPVAGFLALEGAHALEGDLGAVDVLYRAGYRMIGLAHFFDNEVAGSVHGLKQYGLTDLGRNVVQRSQALGILIDVAHASHAALADTLKITQKPIIFSHGGVKGVCDTNRNLTDDEVIRIAATGGIIGLGAWDAAACGTAPADLARAMAYVKNLVGAKHVALGTDFDGAIKSAYTLKDYDVLVQALLDEGFTDDEIEDALYSNVTRIFMASLPD